MTVPYPLFLKLDGRLCAVVGAGEVGLRKARSLLDSGARVRVVAPEGAEGMERLQAERGVEWRRRGFRPGDLEGCLLAFAATDDPAVNAAVSAEATERGILCNAADRPEQCDFFVPAAVSRGDLQIAVSTNGKAPEFAREVRRILETLFTEEYGVALELIDQFRRELRRRHPDDSPRRIGILRGGVDVGDLVAALQSRDEKKVQAIRAAWTAALE